MEHEPNNDPLTIRSVSDYLLDNNNAQLEQFSDLDKETELERDEAYTKLLAETLPNSRLYAKMMDAREYSKFSDLNYVSEDPKIPPNVAIKIFSTDPEQWFVNEFQRLSFSIPQDSINRILEKTHYVAGLPSEFSNLSDNDKNFLAIIWEHQLLEERFPEWVLPSEFIKYESKQNVLGNLAAIDAESLAFLGDLYDSDTGRVIIHPKGTIIYAQVQNLVEDPRSGFVERVISGGPKEIVLNPNLGAREIAQIHQFTSKILDFETETGLLVADFKPGNLVFDASGKLILLDTNYISLRNIPPGTEPVEVEKIKLNYAKSISFINRIKDQTSSKTVISS